MKFSHRLYVVLEEIRPGMSKLFTRRATFEKSFEAKGRTDWKGKKIKRSTRP